MSKTNSERLQEIAEGMQDLNERLVYVGGAMAGAYATDPAATEPRTTIDVDCVVNSTSYSEHAAFEELLRQKHFQNDQTPDAPICRWIYNGEKVNVMSMDEKSQSFGNRWYRPGFGKRERFVLESGRSIYRLPATYYIATKIEALLYISEELECALPSDEIERADMILELMRQMATYKSQSLCIQYVSDLHFHDA